MATHGKKYRAAFEKVDRAKRYSFQEAVQLALATHYTKNDQGLDIAVRLGVDPRHADQMVRGTVVLPHGFGLVYGGKAYGVNVNQLTKNTHRDRIAAPPLHRYVPCRIEAVW